MTFLETIASNETSLNSIRSLGVLRFGARWVQNHKSAIEDANRFTLASTKWR